ncbi:hypothetical protein ES708_33503 [subsurface metagenome]
MTFRTIVKEISLDRGIYASFMPKPLVDQPGSGMHTHLSLFEGDSNSFYEAGQEFSMSLTARQFAAGILYHAQEITAVMNQYVNSYKRLWGGAEAPSYVCWGHNNRSALLRIPQYKPGKINSARIEFRALDPTCNPYLAFALLLAAGIDGIDQQMDLEEPTNDDVWELTDAERQAMGIRPLPGSLDAALRQMEKSEFVAGVLGEHVFEYFLRNKHAEWREYRQQITQYELSIVSARRFSGLYHARDRRDKRMIPPSPKNKPLSECDAPQKRIPAVAAALSRTAPNSLNPIKIITASTSKKITILLTSSHGSNPHSPGLLYTR